MWELIIFGAAGTYLYRQLRSTAPRTKLGEVAPSSISPRLRQLTEYADRLFHEKKYLAAEKAYLQVLRVDHKNASGYHHLGMIYLALRNYPDAIESLQIAAQLSPDGASYQHLAQALYDNGNNVKAVAAFEKAIMFEPTPNRYIRLAKAHQKLANYSKAVTALERAVEVESNPTTLAALAEGYEAAGERRKSMETWQRLLDIEPDHPKARAHRRPQTVENTP